MVITNKELVKKIRDAEDALHKMRDIKTKLENSKIQLEIIMEREFKEPDPKSESGSKIVTRPQINPHTLQPFTEPERAKIKTLHFAQINKFVTKINKMSSV